MMIKTGRSMNESKDYSNKGRITSAINKLGYELGIYHNEIDKLSNAELLAVIDNLGEESTDVKLKKGVVEITTIDNEKDVQWLSHSEYKSRYGDDDDDY